MIELDLPALKKLCEAATPGPWVKNGQGAYVAMMSIVDDRVVEYVSAPTAGMCLSEGDMRFIAAARTEMPRLIEEVEKHRQDLADALTDFPVGMPEPGTELSVLLKANVLMRRENTALKAEVARLMELTANGTLEELRANTTRQIQDMAIQTQINADKRERRLEKESQALREALVYARSWIGKPGGEALFQEARNRINAALGEK